MNFIVDFQPKKMAMNAEEFKVVNTFDVEPNRYMVSNYGRVFDRYRGLFVAGKSTYNRMYANLQLQNGEFKSIPIDHLMMSVFDYRDDYKDLYINHLDGLTLDTRMNNQEWVAEEKKKNQVYMKNGQRLNIGESAYKAKLTEAEVHDICKRFENGESLASISTLYNKVSMYTIFHIKVGKTWKHISSQYNMPPVTPNCGATNGSAKFTESQIKRVCEMFQEGYNYDEVLKETGVSKPNLYCIKKRKTWLSVSKDYKW